MPECRAVGTCPVYDLARDPAVNSFIDRYRAARGLYELNKIPSLLEAELSELGLLEDREFLVRLEVANAELSHAAAERRKLSQSTTSWTK